MPSPIPSPMSRLIPVQIISQSLKKLPFFSDIKRFVIAYSGGVDSHALLHSLSVIRHENELGIRELIAVHINHGLSEKADQWTVHCHAQSRALDVMFTHINVDATPKTGESLEAVARDARYQAFREFMLPGDCLLTAHHQDDQAETLMLQLLRGAGPRGLSAMPVYSHLSCGWQVRPLLNCSREDLQAYAQHEGLLWIEDDSNSDTRFDRNYLRHEIMPKLKSRFPGMTSTLSRSASLCAEASELLVNTAKDDLKNAQFADRSFSVYALQNLGEIRARNLLHQYCREQALPTPSAAQLQCVWDEVVGAAADSEPLVRWRGGEVRRYRDVLYISPPLANHDVRQRLTWDLKGTLLIPDLGELRGVRVVGQGVALWALQEKNIEICFRQGGEKLRPMGRNGHHALKKLFQEVGVPPWLRERIPLLYADGQLLAVAGLWVADEVAAMVSTPGIRLDWSTLG